MDASKRINSLFSKYLTKQITEAEWEELLVWLSHLTEEEQALLAHSNKQLWEQAKNGLLLSTHHQVNWNQLHKNITQYKAEPTVIGTQLQKSITQAEAEPTVIGTQLQKSITQAEAEPTVVPLTTTRKLFAKRVTQITAAAAVLILTLSAGIYLLLQRPARHIIAATYKAPSKKSLINNKAILTLANGSTILLDSASAGNLAQQGNTKIILKSPGLLTYEGSTPYPLGRATGGEAHVGETYNTISTPPGGQYQVVLPDGSKVWLNALSSLKFPTSFTSKQRTVELTGEAYFEIAPNSSQPFYVKHKQLNVQVLGTSFNIMAYEDEPSIKTTLLQGSIKVTKGISSVLLKPGQQAQLNNQPQTPTDQITITTTNPETTIAWVKGYFYFEKADIKTVFRHLSRWYDLDIIYPNDIPNDVFSGKIERSLPLPALIRLLTQENVHLQLKGKKLTILP